MAGDRTSNTARGDPPPGAEKESFHEDLEKIDRSSKEREFSESSLGSEFGHGSSKPIILSFEPNDQANPHNWRPSLKVAVLLTACNALLNGTMGSSLTSGSSSDIEEYFHVNEDYDPWHVLPTSIYLVGYLIANPIWAPLSERFGRKRILAGSFFGVLVWMMACALAPNYTAFIIFRFLLGFFAGAPEANIGGVCADLYGEEKTRGRAVATYNVVSQWGRVLGPIVSGFSATIQWRWVFWIGLMYAGISWVPILLMPEIRHSVLLERRAKRMRQGSGQNGARRNVYGPRELDDASLGHLMRVVLLRPLRMFVVEPIVFAVSLYLAFCYGLFYIFFQSYKTVFVDTYGFSEGEKGLAFIAIGVGVFLAVPIQVAFEKAYRRAVESNTPWAKHHGAHRLPLSMIAGPLISISLFWSGWTARPSVHWIAPTLAGVPFGMGYTLLFISLINYLVDYYAEYAGSAVAATTFVHGIFGVALPFAATPMYSNLGIAWATSTLGFLAAALSLIPFAFWIWGHQLLVRSYFAMELAGEGGGEEGDGDNHRPRRRRRSSLR